MSNLMVQAQEAVAQEDWLLLHQCLQQLLHQEEDQARSPLATDQDDYLTVNTDLDQVLSLALAGLRAGDFRERWDIAKFFPQLGDRAIPPLIELLQDETADWELRWFAVRILGEFQQPEVIATLIELLKTTHDDELSSIAAEALTQLGEPAVVALSELLQHEEWRLLAVQALARMQTPITLDPLLSVVNASQAEVRAAAIAALSSVHDPRVTPVLVHALDDVAVAVRREAIIGLGLRPDLATTLNLVDLLKERLWDLNLDVCHQAAIALGRLKTDAAAQALEAVLRSPHTPLPLQLEAIRVLGWMQTDMALHCLDQGVQLTSVAVCRELAMVLGRIDVAELVPNATEMLIRLLNSSDLVAQHLSVKQTAALGLGQLGHPSALDPLIELLADPDISIRLHAIAALKQLSPETAHQRLQEFAAMDSLSPELQQGVAIALQEW